ncbi:MAG: hypothetical protein C4548_10065 [Desulfobacteraceae bacterium]|jgi:hypothetical protein|nr:MAG: hypothetical protein C4548_10065 [Desulfobacteraceae bacterium]
MAINALSPCGVNRIKTRMDAWRPRVLHCLKQWRQVFLLKDFAAGDTAGFKKPSDDGHKKRDAEIKIPTSLFRLECSVRY